MTTLRQKTLALVGVTLIGLIAVLYVSTRTVLLTSFTQLEMQETQERLEQMTALISDQILDLDHRIADWSNWDDTYAFIQDGNASYVQANLMDTTFINLNINMMLFINNQGSIVLGKAFDLVHNQSMPVPKQVIDAIPLFLKADREDGDVSGILSLPNGPMIVVVRPILPNLSRGTPRGVLVWGHYLDSREIAWLSETFGLPTTIYALDAAALPDDVRTASANLSNTSPEWVSALSEQQIAGYALVNNLYGQPGFIVRLEKPRAIYQEGLSRLTYLLVALVGAGGIFIVLVLFIMERLVLARIARLSRGVRGIRGSRDLTVRVALEGSDELTQLATSINDMLDALTSSHDELHNVNAELEQRVLERTEDLRRTKDRVEAILNNSGDAIILARDDGVIRQTNTSFDVLLGYMPDALFGKSFVTTLAPDDTEALAMTLHSVVADRKPRRLEITAHRSNESTFTADLSMAAINEPGHDQPLVICSLRDISERKLLEENLRAALQKERELSELKTRFSSMVSHEFRSPLSAILFLSELLQNRQYELPLKKQQEYLTRITAETNRLVDLLDDILAISRTEALTFSLTPVRMDLASFCSKIVEEMRVVAQESHPIEFRDESQGQPTLVMIDPKLIRQALTNLISNAVKYSSKGTSIDVVLGCTDGKRATVQVHDHGIGIPEKDQPRLFQMFHRADNVGSVSGTGLGLAIVKRVIETHGGTVSVESQEEVGSTFTITLPLAELPDLSQAPPAG